MSSKSGILQTKEFPILEMSATDMILPTTAGAGNLKRHAELLVAARKNQLPYVFGLLNRPGKAELPERLYSIGVVMGIEGSSSEKPVVYLEGKYRAEIVSIARLNQPYWTAIIGNMIEDVKEELFIENKGEMILDPKAESHFQGLFFNMRIKIGQIIDESINFIDSQVDRLEGLYDNFGNLDLTRRQIIDELIWNIVMAVPHIDSDHKQRFISHRSLMQRIGDCLALLESNLSIIISAKDQEASSSRRPRSIKSGGDSIPKNSDFDDDFYLENKDEDLADRYRKYLEIKKSIKDDDEREIFEESLMADFKRLKALTRNEGSEADVINRYIDYSLSLPWGIETTLNNDISDFEKIFEDEHFGLEKIKNEVADYVSVKITNPESQGRVLCFVGPSGVGKTSVCRSIAHGLKAKYVRMSLGGVRDEAEIRGHRRTYIGAFAGSILNCIKKAGSKNPVFVLDEIDKVSLDAKGDPAAALLEVLDPEQNSSFKDHYLDVPFDLSRVLFITTANSLSRVPAALKDRMDIIQFSSYTEDEKVIIGVKFLVPKVIQEIGLDRKDFILGWNEDKPEPIIRKIIRGYTREAGVRDLERNLARIVRKLNRAYLKDPKQGSRPVLTEEKLVKLLGRPRYVKKGALSTDIGEVIGLVVDDVGGGEMTYVQAKLSLKTGPEKSISQTDQAGTSLYKSNQRAVTVAKGILEKYPEIIVKLNTHLINIQVSDSFGPADGPSAGVTVVVAIISELMAIAVRPLIAMTGAVALTGRIKSVGGIKEKVLAAASAGILEIILPESNRATYEDSVPESVKNKFQKVHFAENMKQVLEISFGKEI